MLDDRKTSEYALICCFFLEADQKDPLHLMQISGPLDIPTWGDEHIVRLLLPKLDERMRFCVGVFTGLFTGACKKTRVVSLRRCGLSFPSVLSWLDAPDPVISAGPLPDLAHSLSQLSILLARTKKSDPLSRLERAPVRNCVTGSSCFVSVRVPNMGKNVRGSGIDLCLSRSQCTGSMIGAQFT